LLDNSPYLFTDTELDRIKLRPRLTALLSRTPGLKVLKFRLEKLGNTITPDLYSKVFIINLISPGYFIGEDGKPLKLINPIITGRISLTNFLTKLYGIKLVVLIPLYTAFLNRAFRTSKDNVTTR